MHFQGGCADGTTSAMSLQRSIYNTTDWLVFHCLSSTEYLDEGEVKGIWFFFFSKRRSQQPSIEREDRGLFFMYLSLNQTTHMDEEVNALQPTFMKQTSLSSLVLLRPSPSSSLGRQFFFPNCLDSEPDHKKIIINLSMDLQVLLGRGRTMATWSGILARTCFTGISLSAKEKRKRFCFPTGEFLSNCCQEISKMSVARVAK